MKNKLIKFITTLDELPNIPHLDKLSIAHLKILHLIKNNALSRAELLKMKGIDSVSRAQKYRYINELIKFRLIKFENKKLVIA